MDHMIACNFQAVAQSDEPAEIYHPTLLFPTALKNIF